MPFKSPAQRRFFFATHPDIAARWAAETKGEGIEIRVQGMTEFLNKTAAVRRYAPQEYSDRIQFWGKQLVEEIKRRASRRPGPRVVTGRYRDSWHLITYGRFSVAAASNAPQARRLEYGFVGRDSMGRFYHQPPFPHVTPARTALAPKMVKDIGNVVPEIWEGS